MKPETEHLITKEQALELLFQGWMPEMETETIPLDQAAGRVLAEDRYARYDIRWCAPPEWMEWQSPMLW